MKTIFNFILFVIAFVIGLLFVISFKIASFIIGIIFMALIIVVCIYVFTLIIKNFSEDNNADDINKNYKFTDDPRFKEKK